MYAKIKSNGQLQIAPNPLRIVISNPTDIQYKEWGWLPVINIESPEYDPETHYAVSHYELDGEQIKQVWEIFENILDEETIISDNLDISN